MRKTMTNSMYLAMLLLPMAAFGAPGNSQCGNGTLLDMQVTVEKVQSGASEHGRVRVTKNGKQEYDGYLTNYSYTQTTYTVTVRLDDMVYTAQSESIFGLGFKPTAFVVNDPIRVCLRGNTLGLERPDGKQYKARLIRAVRDVR